MVIEVLVPVVVLVKFEVTFHMIQQGVRYRRSAFGHKPLQQEKPLIEEVFAIWITHLNIEVLGALSKLAHDDGETCDAHPHADDSDYLF